MTATIPLFYQNTVIGEAKVDLALKELPPQLRFGVIPPRNYQRMLRDRPDVVIALLKDDPEILRKCHPFVWIRNRQLRLSRIAANPELVPLLIRFVHEGPTNEVVDQILDERDKVVRAVFRDSDRTNCTSENLVTITNV